MGMLCFARIAKNKTRKMKLIYKKTCKVLSLPVVLFMLSSLISYHSNAQSMGISSSSITPDASSILEIRTTTKGLLIPRMTTTERDAITSPATGLEVYNTTTNKFNFYNGSAWTVLLSGTSAVNSVSGTTNRISIGGTSTDPTVDISSSYVGQSSITTLGTIGTGTWNGSAVTAAYGGTGIASYTVGDILYASGSTTLSKLADVATGNVLISGGTSTAPSYGKVGLTTHVSGTLPIANGGTNSTATPTNGGIVYGDGSAHQVSSAGTSGQVLKSAGAAAPVWVDGGLMMLTGNSNNSAVNNTTLYFPASGILAGGNSDLQAGTRSMVSHAGTIKNLYVKLSAAIAAGKTGTVTVFKNGVATSLVATLSVGPVDFNDTAHSFSVVAGDELSVQVTTTGNVKFLWAFDFTY